MTTDVDALAASGVDVLLVVDQCMYACCGGRWSRREGYEQVYRGVVKTVLRPPAAPTSRLILHATAIGTLNYAVIAELAHVKELGPLVDYEGAYQD